MSLQRWAQVEEHAAPNRTLCDYDGDLPKDIADRVHSLARMLDARVEWMRIDRTARGWHLVVEWNRDFEPAQTIALQAILGSDPKREALNLWRVLSGIRTEGQKKCWNILYRRKLGKG